MPTHRYQVVVEWDPAANAWVTLVPGLGSLSTYGDTREEALAETREAIIGYLEAAAKEGLPLPDAEVGVELVELEVATP